VVVGNVSTLWLNGSDTEVSGHHLAQNNGCEKSVPQSCHCGGQLQCVLDACVTGWRPLSDILGNPKGEQNLQKVRDNCGKIYEQACAVEKFAPWFCHTDNPCDNRSFPWMCRGHRATWKTVSGKLRVISHNSQCLSDMLFIICNCEQGRFLQ